jgi:succinate dehydrogenase/fumarate reductase flavoprotein subunit
MRQLETDVLVVGAGGAGMYAAIEAAKHGASVLLADRGLIGRSGATVMAQMTVAAAMGQPGEDSVEAHLADTLKAGRGLCETELSKLLCEEGLECVRQLDEWGVGWARVEGNLTPVMAPGHDRPRCVYVDFLSTGPAVSRTLRTQVIRTPGVQRVGDLCITDLVIDEGRCVGAVGIHLPTGEPISIIAPAVILACGGLTRLYARNSASANMGGDAFALALRAGARLIDMEFVQFFPIGHLAPRMIGMDPIMWDPFRYKLGGRLLNGQMEEFTHRYGTEDGGRYTITRDQATYAITKEVEAGRGSPHGGAWLSFQHVPAEQLREAFGPVIDRLARNGIDLTTTPVEVAPIAHYHMGGVGVDTHMATRVPGLFVGGEAVGGANGANRLSGNAITEAFAFGRRAGASAAEAVAAAKAAGGIGRARAQSIASRLLAATLKPGSLPADANTAAAIDELQTIMSRKVGPFRTEAGLREGLASLRALAERYRAAPATAPGAYDPVWLDWFDLRNMTLVAEAVTLAAIERTESRGAHQREDHPGLDEAWTLHLQSWLAAPLDPDHPEAVPELELARVPVNAGATA